MNMIEELKQIGLSDNEAKTYMAMLELGPAPVSDIARRAKINRPTAYVQIESLKKMGLASTQTKGKKTLYVAESPDQLESLLKTERAKFDVKEKNLKDLLPILAELFHSYGDSPQVRFFDGAEGIARIQREALNSKDKIIRNLSSLDSVRKTLPKNVRSDYDALRIKKKILAKFLYTSSEGEVFPRIDKKGLREAKRIPPGKLSISFDFGVFGDTVTLMSFKGNIFGVIIKHKDIADSFKNLFDFLWDKV